VRSRAWSCLFSILLVACGSDDASPGGTGAGGSGAAGGAAGASGGSGAAGGAAGNGGTAAGGGSAGAGGAGGSGGSMAGCAKAADGIAVADVDLDGYPSYAVDGCRLAYVAAPSGELRLRDLALGSEQVIAGAADAPRRPSLAGEVLAWEATDSGVSVVRVQSGGQIATLAGSFDHAGEPRATSDAVVFTAWQAKAADSDSDVLLYTVGDQSLSVIAAGPGQQRFADVSATHVAVSDFSEDPGGIYAGDGTSLADVIVFDRGTGTSTTRKLPGKQAFPMLGSNGTLSYLEWLEVHPVPKLQDYSIQAVPLSTLGAAGKEIAHVQSEQAVRPTAHGGKVEWVVRWGQSALWRAALDQSTPPVQIPLGSAAVLHAPAATGSMTVLAASPTAGAPPALISVTP
jgi:hypothetical protein